MQLVFYLLYGNMQVAFAFLLSCFFRDTRTANVACWIWVLGAGLLARFLLEPLVIANRWWTTLVQLIPTFGAYRCVRFYGSLTLARAFTACIIFQVTRIARRTLLLQMNVLELVMHAGGCGSWASILSGPRTRTLWE